MIAPREISLPFDAEAFGCEAHNAWYAEVERAGPHDRYSMESAESWWNVNVRVGSGYQAYGMPHPSTQAEVAQAYASFDALCREALGDRRAEEYEEAEHVGRTASRWESVDE